MISTALRAALSAYSGVTDIVGERIFANRVPEGQGFPCIVLLTRNQEDARSLRGYVNMTTTPQTIYCLAASYREVEQLAYQVRDVIEPLEDGVEYAGVRFIGVRRTGSSEGTERPLDRSDTVLNYVSVDYELCTQEV